MVNTALVSAGFGAITQSSTKDQAKSKKFDIATGKKAAVHRLAEKLILQIMKFNIMED